MSNHGKRLQIARETRRNRQRKPDAIAALPFVAPIPDEGQGSFWAPMKDQATRYSYSDSAGGAL